MLFANIKKAKKLIRLRAAYQLLSLTPTNASFSDLI